MTAPAPADGTDRRSGEPGGSAVSDAGGADDGRPANGGPGGGRADGGQGGSSGAEGSGSSWAEGSGIVSSYHDLGAALEDQDGAGVAWAAAAAGLDTLGFVADPFGALGSALAGWAIEHLWFLREPLDALAGDPDEIAAVARSRQELARELTAAAAALRATAADACGAWQGTACDGFADTAGEGAAAAARAAEQSMLVADLVLRTGATVGAERAILRDAVADFLASLVSAGVLSLITSGAAAPLTVTNAVLDAVQLGHRLSDRVTALIEALRRAAGVAEEAERVLRAALPQLDRAVEHGKQDAAARASAAEGRAEPAP